MFPPARRLIAPCLWRAMLLTWILGCSASKPTSFDVGPILVKWEDYFDSLCGRYVIQIGANVGNLECAVAGEPVWQYQKKYQWRGAVIEANPITFEKLRTNYRDFRPLPINLAISNETGSLNFWCPRMTGFSCGTELCTSVRANADRMGQIHGEFVHSSVRAVTLSQLWQFLSPEEVDILVVDVEGAEERVLTQGFPEPKPKMVFYESVGNRSLHHIRSTLRKEGYKAVRLGNGEGFGERDDLWMQSELYPRVGPNVAPSYCYVY